MKILYCGPLRRWSLTEERMLALRALGHEVATVDERAFLDRGPFVVQKLQRHLLAGPGPSGYNAEVVRAARAFRPDLVWIDQGGQIRPETVAALKATGARLLHHTTDYLEHKAYWFRHYMAALPGYDVHVVTNALNVAILEARGARRVVVDEFAYAPDRHRPPVLSDEDRRQFGAAAVFVGHWEPSTERMVLALQRAGVDIRVHGPGWWRARGVDAFRRMRPLYGDAYVKALATARLCLGFLSKRNRNQSAVRTFEIPAVGGFLLAERTADHGRYFAEGAEAEYFGSPDELVEKARFYLSREYAREAVAAAGHRRCVTSPYTWVDRCERVLEMAG